VTYARHGEHPIRYSLVTAPAVEPVALADAKTFLRVDLDITQDDALISVLITAARRYAESYTGLSFITQTWKATFDQFPGVVIPPTPFAAVAAWLPNPQPSPEIKLMHGPIQAVGNITYLDTNGTAQTLVSGTDFVTDLSGIYPRIAPAQGKNWPATYVQIGACSLTFTAGYGVSADTVPAEVAHWILMRVGTLYENRESVAILNRGKVEALPFVDSLLDYLRQPVI
jgi:hypothetical protein